MSFYYDKKTENENLAEKALIAKDYKRALFHTAEAARYTFSLAEQCQGLLRAAYLKNANDLVDIAEKIKEKAKTQKNIQPSALQTAANQDQGSAASGKCRVERPSVRLDDVAGMEDVKAQIRLRLIEPLKDKENARKHGLKVGGGILLYGPPGTGKTFIAKAVAGELNLPFYSITSADVFGKYVGESENNIRALFAEARENPLSVIFIDELETIFHKRSDSIHETTNKVISVILQELDGVDENKNPIMLLGATNTPWLVDEAFLRTGRFDVRAYVGLPELAARKKIIQNAFKEVEYPVSEDAINFLSEKTEGMCGADLKGIAMKIKQVAFDRKLTTYTRDLFEDCLQDYTPSNSAETQKLIKEWEKRSGIERNH